MIRARSVASLAACMFVAVCSCRTVNAVPAKVCDDASVGTVGCAPPEDEEATGETSDEEDAGKSDDGASTTEEANAGGG